MADVPQFTAYDNNDSCAIMVAHYFHHLYIVNYHIFISIAIIHTKYVNDIGTNDWKDYWVYGDADERRIPSACLLFIHLIANWLCIRYHFQLPFNLLLINIALLIDPINALSSFICPGSRNILPFVTEIPKLNCRI